MLTKASWDAISRTILHGSLIHAFPFKWNAKEFRLIPIPHPTANSWLSWAIAIYIWTYNVFLFYSYEHWRHKLSPSGHVMHIIWILCYTFGSVFSFNNIKYPQQIALLFNNFFQAIKLLETNYDVKRQVGKNGKLHWCEQMLQWLWWIGVLHCFLSGLIFFEDPAGSRYIFALIGRRNSPIWMLMIFCAFEILTYMIMWQVTLVNTLLMISYWYVTSLTLKEIRSRKFELLAKGPELFLVYRTFQFLNQEFNAVYSKLVLPWIQMLFLVVPVVANYATIRLHDVLSLPILIAVIILSVTCISFVVIAFPQAAATNSHSAAYIRWLKLQFIDKWSKKTIRSFPTLKVRFGGFFFLQKFTPFKMSGLIIYWTMRSLLLF